MNGNPSGFTFGTFTWWVGVVEDRMNDPLKIGRIKVRIFGFHSESKTDVPTADLPWATLMMPAHGASSTGYGISPTGILEGSHVIGFFLDGENAQTPVVMGTLHGMPNNKPDTFEVVRGENINSTFVGEKKSDALMSTADGNSMSLDSLTQSLSDVTSTINNGLTDLRNFTQNFSLPAEINVNSVISGLSGAGALGSIDGLSGLANIPDIGSFLADTSSFDVPSLSNMIQGHLGGISGQIESLTGQLSGLTDPLAVAGVQSQIRALTSQYNTVLGVINGVAGGNIPGVSDIIGGLANIQSAAGLVNQISSAIQSVQSLASVASSLKSLAGGLFGGGSVMALINGLKSGALKNTWQEPPTPADPKYPYNNVLHTESGQVQEFDNTPGKERYQRWHPSGSFIEVHPDGTQVEKIVKDNYTVTMGNDHVHVEGNVQVNIKGNSTVVVNGNCNLRVNGDMTESVSGDYSLAVGGDLSVVVGGSHKQSAGTHFQAKAPRIDLN